MILKQRPREQTVIAERTYDCEPTLTDHQVVDFCKNGFVMLKAVVPAEINRRALAFLDQHPQMEPDEILEEDWFVDGVIKHPQAAGAVRSLLGKRFKLPPKMSNHRVQCPRRWPCGWHRDGGAIDSPQLHSLQVFYYPQDVPIALGPTQLLPGSHMLNTKRRFMTHYGGIRCAVSSAAAAGSIFITHYSIWHRATTATASGIRNLLKYNYWRTAAPQRDWVVDPNIDFAQVDMSPFGGILDKHFCVQVARQLIWLCGLGENFEYKGGQSWPMSAGPDSECTEGLPPQLRRISGS